MRWVLGGWHTRRRGVSTIIGVILMLGITIAAGTILWELHFSLPASAPSISIFIRSGTSTPVWGDPTDCTVNTFHYPYVNNSLVGTGYTGAEAHNYQCDLHETGNFSLMNSTQIIITQHSPTSIPLSDVEFIFACKATNALGNNYTTYLVQGLLSSMSWYPGSSTSPPPNAPDLGVCGTFVPSGSYSTLYNRLGIYVPLLSNATVVENGDTFVLYIHTPDSVTDYEGDCLNPHAPGACPDADDYHGAPPWCFTTNGACWIYLIDTAGAGTLLASINVYGISGAGS